MKLLLTIDTEIWPRTMSLRGESIEQLWTRDILGRTPAGDFGIAYQMDVLERCGMRGVFFVEALHADVVGQRWLRETVEPIVARGHEVQLHIHPEWLGQAASNDRLSQEQGAPNRGPAAQFMWQLAPDEQVRVMRRGVALLRAAGASDVSAFRAGGFGAGLGTLEAVAAAGLRIDASHNPSLPARSHIASVEPGQVVAAFGAVCEVPQTVYEDRPGHLRHAQIGACSASELTHLINAAERQGRGMLNILSHSFELIRRCHQSGLVAPDWLAIRRFEAFCEAVSRHARVDAVGFNDLSAQTLEDARLYPVLRSNWLRTGWRNGEQLLRRGRWMLARWRHRTMGNAAVASSRTFANE